MEIVYPDREGSAPHRDHQPGLAEQILELLAAHGVTRCFGLPGVHNLPLWRPSPGAPRIVAVRHEQTAVYAADGTWRAGLGPGVALLTSGPGAANGVAAFGEAAAAGSGVVVIASEAPLSSRGRPRLARIAGGLLHETTDQAAMFASLGVAHSVTAADQVLPLLTEALNRAAGRLGATGPTYVGIPSDLLAGPAVTGPAVAAPADTAQPWSSQLRAALEPLRECAHVVVWAGGGVAATNTEPLLAALVDGLGALLLTSFAGRGLLAEHPGTLHAPVHEPAIAQLLADAHGLLVIGSGFDAMNTRGWTTVLPPTVVVLDIDAEQVARNLPGARAVTLDLTSVGADLEPAKALIAEVLGPRAPVGPEQVDDAWRTQARATVAAVRSSVATDRRTSAAATLVAAVEQGWPADATLVLDMCVAGYWLAGYGRQPRPRRMAYPVGWGTLGFGFPAGIGAAAHGHPTLVVCGDGGIAMGLGELGTLVQERLPLTVLVVDDAGYGMLRYDQQVEGAPELGVDLLAPRWHLLASAYGLGFAEVDSPEHLADALADAHTDNLNSRPVLMVLTERLMPPRTTSPRWFEPS